MSEIKKIQFGETEWVNVKDVDKETMEKIGTSYRFHHLDIEDCLSETQRAKIDEYERYLFIVLHLPTETPKGRIVQGEINIFIGQNYLITISDSNKALCEIFDNCKRRKNLRTKFMEKGAGYLLYKIVDDLFADCFPFIDQLSKSINVMEKAAFDIKDQKDMLEDILALKKDIINFRRIIVPQRALIAQLEHKNKKFLPENLEVYFDDVVDKIEKIWSNLENLKELVESLQDTNESLISHNTNNAMKVLTIFSVIMLPLTVITGAYGMNLNTLPFAGHPMSFMIVMGMMGIVIISMLIFFKHKRWL